MKLSEANIGDRVKLGITKEGWFPYKLSDANRIIEVVVASHSKTNPNETYVIWEKPVPEFDHNGPLQSILRIRRQQYRIPHQFSCGYHINNIVEVEKINVDTKTKRAAKPPSASSLPLLLACIGAGAALSTLSSPSTISNQPKKALL